MHKEITVLRHIVCNDKQANKKNQERTKVIHSREPTFKKSWYIHTMKNYIASTNDHIEEYIMTWENLPSLC